MTTKDELFNDLMDNYKEQVANKSYVASVEEFIAKYEGIYNKEWERSYPAGTKKDDKEPFILLNNAGNEGFFFDPELQMRVEDIKRSEISAIDVGELKNNLVSWSIEYCCIENRKVTGEVVANPMNVYAGLSYLNFIQDKLDKTLLEGHRYSPYDILKYYTSESEGYKKIVAEIMKKFFIILLEEKKQDVHDLDIIIEVKNNNQYVLHAKKSNKEREMLIVCKFLDGYYHYWNENDERNVGEFNLDLVFPDYKEFL